LEAVLAIVGGKWRLLILYQLSKRAKHFAELHKAIPGVSEKVLTAELKQLVDDCIITRREYYDMRPRVEYALSEFGEELAAELEPICRWGWNNKGRIGNLPTKITDVNF
jgi:DNA-binding HxlR family transcriptional regulator